MPGCNIAAECHPLEVHLTRVQHQSFHLLCCLLQCVHAYASFLTIVLQLHPDVSAPLHRNAQKSCDDFFQQACMLTRNVWLGLFCKLPCCIRFAVLSCYALLDLKAQESSLHHMRGKI